LPLLAMLAALLLALLAALAAATATPASRPATFLLKHIHKTSHLFYTISKENNLCFF
jgi:hypothetical protein